MSEDRPPHHIEPARIGRAILLLVLGIIGLVVALIAFMAHHYAVAAAFFSFGLACLAARTWIVIAHKIELRLMDIEAAISGGIVFDLKAARRPPLGEGGNHLSALQAELLHQARARGDLQDD